MDIPITGLYLTKPELYEIMRALDALDTKLSTKITTKIFPLYFNFKAWEPPKPRQKKEK